MRVCRMRHAQGTVVCMLPLLIALLSPAHGAVWHVNAASNASAPDGTSWENAFPDIPQASERAVPGDDIWVAAGLYTAEMGHTVVTIRNITRMYGGFKGMETDPGQREIGANPSIIDGEGLRRCVTADQSCTIDGFVLRNGHANSGGGLLDGSAVNCVFLGNYARDFGGGMCWGRAEGCIFTGNDAYWGGGMHEGSAVNCSFVENSANWGGGMVDSQAADCVFEKNTASYGGGIFRTNATNCTFTKNNAYRGGGAAEGFAINCVFSENEADTNGGGIYDVSAECCVLKSNTAQEGGGSCFGSISNCILIRNKAAEGAGVYYGTAVNCTITANIADPLNIYADYTSSIGGGMHDGTAVNCIIWGNSPTDTVNTAATHCCLSTIISGTGNTSGNPCFVNPWADDFRLRSDSPCVDAGTQTGAPWQDITGRNRPSGAGVDMGAHEHLPPDDEGALPPPDAIRVNASSTASAPDGRSWETAFRNLQEGANHAGFGVEIWVAKGVYTADTGTEVVRPNPVTDIYGGFNGTETLRRKRDWRTNKTRLDGLGFRRCVTADYTVTVDGLILQNGYARDGGGMLFGMARNCLFTNNMVSSDGAGIYSGTAVNCVFSNNFSRIAGGGAFNATCVNCTFLGNSSSYYGGGSCLGEAVNCVFWKNKPDDTSSTLVSHSCLETPTEGPGNISADPCFVGLWPEDLRLRSNSPCVDTGTPSGAPPADMLGRARPAGAGVDMGAYEHYAPDDGIVSVHPDAIRVNAASTASNPDGLSWETAFPNLQAGADHAGYGVEIWVAGGVYTEAIGAQVVMLRQGTAMYGGFNGTETAREQRDARTNLTVVDGDNARRCITSEDSCLVDGFTLQNGNAVSGGGIYLGSAVDCVFLLNNALSSGGGLSFGKAVKCVFTDNSARSGGGAYNCTLVNSVVSGNKSTMRGGGAYQCSAYNCTFVNNHCSYGGGMYGGTAVNCIIWGNGVSDCHIARISYSCLSSPSYVSFVSNDSANEGNIIAGDPGFVNPWAGDFRLRSDSPCVDAGTVVDAPLDDMQGRTRPQGMGVDMGAHEHSPADDDDVVATPGPLRVNAASTASNPDGSSWETAFPTLREAAELAEYGVEIWVAGGVYTAPLEDTVVELKAATRMYGGFNGTETRLEQRDAAANPTIIDGQGGRQCVTMDNASILDGFTIQNGFSESYGGGVFGGNIFTCVLISNHAQSGGGAAFASAEDCLFQDNTALYDGGGIFAGRTFNCVFTGNSAQAGGAMAGGDAFDCMFTQNHAVAAGGGLFATEATGSVFTQNSAPNGGAMSSGTAQDCAFIENTAVDYGGGVVDATTLNCLFVRNNAREGGGASTAPPQTPYDTPPAKELSGGDYYREAVNCVFEQNFAEDGGGASSMSLVNCTLFNNSASSGGGVFYCTAKNCIVWNNFGGQAFSSGLSHCCLSEPGPGDNNITANPAFANPRNGDFRIRSGSSCIDTGTPEHAPDTDMRGVARPQGAGVDIGAFEHCPERDSDIPPPAAIRVSAASTAAAPDGLSWESAFNTIQSAVDNSLPGDVFWVTGGVYAALAGDAVVTLAASMRLYGGFGGHETELEQRDWQLHETVIDGMDSRRCVTASHGCLIDGFTLQNGRAESGGGMIFGTAANCRFTLNTAGTQGGGLYTGNAVNCTFTANSAATGGGLFESAARNCLLLANTARSGAGMAAGTAVNCVFHKNNAEYGGGMAEGAAINCTFVDNHSDNGGGGFLAYSNGEVVNCILWGNTPDDFSGSYIFYSCLSTPVNQLGNIAADPLFANAGAGDFRLLAGSPCVDSGTAANAPDMDMNGTPRPQGQRIDMGAYEFVPKEEEGEGEMEGEPEGEPQLEGEPHLEGEPEGEPQLEGEPHLEGEPEGEPQLEGEPHLEGEPEGEPQLEGEPHLEGEPEGEPQLEGEPHLEGESEGEVAFLTAEEAARLLLDHFTDADADGSGGISSAEASARLAGMNPAIFVRLDENGDGQATEAELRAFMGLSGGEEGCGCGNCITGAKGPWGFKGWLGDLFLAGLALGALVVMARQEG